MSTASLTHAWVPSATTFGTRLAMVRQQMGWNTTEAARECGLGQNDWMRYEANRHPRDLLGTVAKIVDRTGVSRMWLLTGEADPSAIDGGPVTLRYQVWADVAHEDDHADWVDGTLYQDWGEEDNPPALAMAS